MSYLGFGDIPEKLVGNGIHNLENVLTLSTSYSGLFEKLYVWFEAIVSVLEILAPCTEGLQDDRDNTYAIRAMDKVYLRSFRDNPIALTSQYPDLPLPNPTFLLIHAACCKIASLSGATDYILRNLDDMEDIVLLTKGGLSIQVP